MLDRQEFLGIFLREERLLAAYLLGATGDIHAADDLLQTVAGILWEKLADYDETRPFGAWALGVAQPRSLEMAAAGSALSGSYFGRLDATPGRRRRTACRRD